MRRVFILCGAIACLLAADMVQAQVIPGRNFNKQNQKNNGDKKGEQDANPLPNDERLLKFHQEFVKSVEKLAQEYEKGRDYDKAKAAYGEIVKLVPQYGPAKAKFDELTARESTANKHSIEIFANKAWQDTGLRVEAGKPIAIRATGQWVFKLQVGINADGIDIPKELREFNIGCLIGVIDTGSGDPKDFEPFIVGTEEQFVAKKTGKLLLRMWDTDPTDNEGSLKVDFLGSFKTATAEREARTKP